MKQISNQTIIKIARMCKEGQTIEYIQKHTGVKSIYALARKLRNSGANIPLPKSDPKPKKRNWSALVAKINKK